MSPLTLLHICEHINPLLTPDLSGYQALYCSQFSAVLPLHLQMHQHQTLRTFIQLLQYRLPLCHFPGYSLQVTVIVAFLLALPSALLFHSHLPVGGMLQHAYFTQLPQCFPS